MLPQLKVGRPCLRAMDCHSINDYGASEFKDTDLICPEREIRVRLPFAITALARIRRNLRQHFVHTEFVHGSYQLTSRIEVITSSFHRVCNNYGIVLTTGIEICSARIVDYQAE